MTPTHSQRNLIVAMAAALAIGFLLPRPSFVDTAVEGTSEVVDNTEADATAGAGSTPLSATAGGRVTVDFYGESLCPDCQQFVQNILAPMFASGAADAMTLRYIAAGNVKVADGRRGGSQVTCQHGETECKYNRFINCAQKLLDNDQDKWFPYVRCLADGMSKMDKAAAGCAGKAGLEAAAVEACAAGAEGAALEEAAVKETLALTPEKRWVPWVVVNGVALGGAFEDLERYVCVATQPDKRCVGRRERGSRLACVTEEREREQRMKYRSGKKLYRSDWKICVLAWRRCVFGWCHFLESPLLTSPPLSVQARVVLPAA